MLSPMAVDWRIMMILAIDVGNTNIVIGCIEDGRIICDGRLTTDHKKTKDEYAIHFKMFLNMYDIDLKAFDGAIISSVVPPITNEIKGAIQKIIGIEAMLVGHDMELGLTIRTEQPERLGADLIVDAVAALHEYKAPLIIFDLGTATTCSVIDREHNYLGGMIFPGVRVSANALAQNASQLPHISLEAPKHVIGRNTIECMQSGVMLGNAAMIDGMVERVEEELGEPATVIATGGLSKCIIEHCKKKIIYDGELLMKGLWFLYQKNYK